MIVFALASAACRSRANPAVPRCSLVVGRGSFIVGLWLLLVACATSERPPSGFSQEEVSEGTYLVRFTGTPQDSAGAVTQSLLRQAARLTLEVGHAQFAVLERRSEMVSAPGTAPTFGARVPVVRSRQPGRARGGASTSVDLGRPAAHSVVAKVRPFTGEAPEGALAIYDARSLEPEAGQ